MRKVIAAALLLLVAGGGWFAMRAPKVESHPDAPLASEAAPLEAEQQDAAFAARSPRTAKAASKPTAPSDFEPLDVKAFRGEKRRELFLVAQTPEEAHWLESRGYPRPSEWAARNEIALEVLEARIAAGDTLSRARDHSRNTGRIAGCRAPVYELPTVVRRKSLRTPNAAHWREVGTEIPSNRASSQHAGVTPRGIRRERGSADQPRVGGHPIGHPIAHPVAAKRCSRPRCAQASLLR